MKRILAGALVAATLMVSTANAQLVSFPLHPNDSIEYVGNALRSAWFAEKNVSPMEPGVFQYIMVRGRNDGDPPTYVEWYIVDCNPRAQVYKLYANASGHSAGEINGNITYLNNHWRPISGTNPAQVKAKQVCAQTLLGDPQQATAPAGK
jgi:hypothetical protein